MSGGWNSTGMTGGKRGNSGLDGGNQSDFGCSRARRLRESLSLSWWNRENRVLILPILRSTQIWEEIVNGDRPGYLALPGMMPLEGGLPLLYQEQVIGAIGVSGVKSTEDGMVAQAGASAL